MPIKILGITGPTGAGKSLLCKELSTSIPVIDADEIYHSLLIPPSDCLNALRDAFGDDVFLSDGTLNRSALSSIVFSEEDKLTLLNHTVLDFVLKEIRAMISELERAGRTCVLVDAPTLIESGFHLECDAVISLLASPALRLSRIITRDAIPKEKATLRIAAQKDDDFYRAHSDLVLINDGDIDALISRTTDFLATLGVHL